MNQIDRRSFLASAAAAPLFVPACAAPGPMAASAGPIRPAPDGPVAISSGNGRRAVAEAMRRMRAGADPLDAAVAGVSIVEDDPDDVTVGYGGS